MRRLSMHSWAIQFFSFWEVGGGGVQDSFCFFSLFPMCFQKFPRCFHSHSQDVPNSTWVLSHMGFAQSSTPLYINKEDEIQGCTFVSILQLGVQRSDSIRGMPNVLEKLLMGQSIWLLFLKRKSCELTHDLINMNHTTSQPSPYLICSLQGPRGWVSDLFMVSLCWWFFLFAWTWVLLSYTFFFSPLFLFWVLCFIDAWHGRFSSLWQQITKTRRMKKEN
jgi:hypothetical protein